MVEIEVFEIQVLEIVVIEIEVLDLRLRIVDCIYICTSL